MNFSRLNEGITHIEDLSIDKFIDTVKNIFNFHVSEKIDGANLWFGVDDSKLFYTTREQKGRDKDPKYSSKEYAMVAAYNGFRSAHDALEEFMSKREFLNILEPGDKIEVEVVFGKQPNVIQYSNDGVNYIVLLRPVSGTPIERFNKLATALGNREANIQSLIIDTNDGENLVKIREPFKWKFVKNISQKMSKGLISKKTIETTIDKLEHYLKQKNIIVSQALNKEVSNFVVMTLGMGSVPIAVRPQVKKEKDAVNQYVLIEFKIPIKEKLFADLVGNGDFLSSQFNKERGDLEGFVLSKDGQQIKIVDRDLFTAINEFNYKIRNELNGAVMSDDIDAPLEAKGGIFGNCKLRIASLFDIKELARSAKAKKLFAEYRGKTIDETVSQFVASLKIKDFEMYKNKIIAILTDTDNDLTEKLKTFKEEVNEYKVKLKNGKIIPYSDESKKRSLLAFAELKKEIHSLQSKLKKANNIEDVIMALYGKLIEAVQNKSQKETKMNESFSLLKSFNKMLEDEGSEVAPSGPSAEITSSTNIAAVPLKMLNGKIIKRVKRNYFPKNSKLHK